MRALPPLLAVATLLAGCATAGADFVLSPKAQREAAWQRFSTELDQDQAQGVENQAAFQPPEAWREARCRMTSIADVALCREEAMVAPGRWSRRDVRYVRTSFGWRLFTGVYETIGGRYRLASDARGEALMLCWERDALTCEPVLHPRIDQYGGDDRYAVIVRHDLPDGQPQHYYVEAAADGPGTVHGPLTAEAFARDKLRLGLPEFEGIIVGR